MKVLRWTPFALLLGLAFWFGVRMGDTWSARRTTEAIAGVAARYAREVEGARPETCAGRPGEGATWLVVACGRGARLRVYRLDRRGRVIGHPQDGA